MSTDRDRSVMGRQRAAAADDTAKPPPPIKVGTIIRVLDKIDDRGYAMYPPGEVQRVVAYRTNGDKLVNVVLADGSSEYFWTSELEPVNRRQWLEYLESLTEKRP